jgi:hypothetical protein
VNHVVDDAWVVRLLPQDAGQNRGGLLLVGVSLVGCRRGADQSQREEDRGLSILWIARSQPFHRLAPGAGTLLVRDSVRVLVVDFERRDVVSLALGSGAYGLRFLNRGGTVSQLGGVRWSPDGVIKTHGDPPVTHGAAWVHACYLGEGLFGFVIPEGMQHRDRIIEGLLGSRRA